MSELRRRSCSEADAKSVERKLLAQCKGGHLYEDRDFPASSSSIYRRNGRLMNNVSSWMRPKGNSLTAACGKYFSSSLTYLSPLKKSLLRAPSSSWTGRRRAT